jgi:hypothetical protein
VRARALALGLVLAARAALAGTEITVETRRAGAAPEAKPQQSLIAVEGRKLHADAGDGRHGLVYRGEEGVLEVFDHRDKSVFTLDRATARSMARGVDGARDAVRNLPEPQRRAVEGLLGAEQAPAKVELRASGRSDRVNGIACRLSDALRNGVRLAEICEGPRGAAGVSPEALAPLRELAAFAAEVGDLLPRSMAGEGLDALVLVERVQGVPLRVRAFPKDAPATESRIVRAVPKRFGPERFQAPPGYTPGLGLRVRERDGVY